MYIYIVLFVISVILIVVSNRYKRRQEMSLAVDLQSTNSNQPSVEQLQYFCVKDKGYHVSVWPKDQKIGDYLEFNIAGMSHRTNINHYLGEFIGTLEAEPTNTYDPNAIKILASDGHHVGYVPKDQTHYVREFLSLPCQCFCYIGCNDGYYYSDCYITNNQMFPQ